MRTRLWSVPVLAALIISAATVANAQTLVKKGGNLVEVTVVGQGETKEEAISDAKRKAVEYGAGTTVYSQSKTRDFVLEKDTVLTRSAGFVQAFDDIYARQTVDDVWEVKARVTVSIKGIEDTWGVVRNLLKEKGHPKIMVFIKEMIGKDLIENSTVQTRIENLLLKNGFLLVNREQIKAIDRKAIAAAIADDNPAKIQAIARRFGAQLFVTGTANATGGPTRLGNIRAFAYEAEANVKCFRSDTAQLLSSIPGAATRGVQRVWRSAAKQSLDLQAQTIAPKVRRDILRFWMDALSGGGEVKLEVSGVSFEQYIALEEAIKKVEGVKSVNVEYDSNIATCSVQTTLSAKALAIKIVKAKIKGLKVVGVSQNVIRAKMPGE